MSIDNAMTDVRLLNAQTHVLNVCADGGTITLVKALTKDEMGEILTESTQDLKSFPVRFAPFDRQVIEKIGWAENVDVLCFVSKLAIDNLSLTLTKLKQYKNLRHEGKTFELSYIDYYSSFKNDFLYIIIGGKK